ANAAMGSGGASVLQLADADVVDIQRLPALCTKNQQVGTAQGACWQLHLMLQLAPAAATGGALAQRQVLATAIAIFDIQVGVGQGADIAGVTNAHVGIETIAITRLDIAEQADART